MTSRSADTSPVTVEFIIPPMAHEDRLQSPSQSRTRTILRWLGSILLTIGSVLTLVGFGNLFLSFTSLEPPRLFWCAFVGLPLMFVGGAMILFGFLGALQRYVAGETAPVAKDVVNYMGDNVQEGVKTLAKSVTEGIRDGLSSDKPDAK